MAARQGDCRRGTTCACESIQVFPFRLMSFFPFPLFFVSFSAPVEKDFFLDGLLRGGNQAQNRFFSLHDPSFICVSIFPFSLLSFYPVLSSSPGLFLTECSQPASFSISLFPFTFCCSSLSSTIFPPDTYFLASFLLPDYGFLSLPVSVSFFLLILYPPCLSPSKGLNFLSFMNRRSGFCRSCTSFILVFCTL